MDLTDIIAYLNGHSTEEESRSIEQWIAESDANKVFFEETKVIWQHSQAPEAERLRMSNWLGNKYKGVHNRKSGVWYSIYQESPLHSYY